MIAAATGARQLVVIGRMGGGDAFGMMQHDRCIPPSSPSCGCSLRSHRRLVRGDEAQKALLEETIAKRAAASGFVFHGVHGSGKTPRPRARFCRKDVASLLVRTRKCAHRRRSPRGPGSAGIARPSRSSTRTTPFSSSSGSASGSCSTTRAPRSARSSAGSACARSKGASTPSPPHAAWNTQSRACMERCSSRSSSTIGASSSSNLPYRSTPEDVDAIGHFDDVRALFSRGIRFDVRPQKRWGKWKTPRPR